MKNFAPISLLCLLLAASCVEKSTDGMFTEAAIAVRPPEGVEPVRFQATMVFENINTKQRVSTSDFVDGVLEIRLLKGLYRLSIAEGGGLSYIDGEGRTRFSEVTVDSSPVELLDDAESHTVDLILKN